MKSIKKLFISFLAGFMLFSGIAHAGAVGYMPAPGPLNLGDSYVINPVYPTGPMIIKRGLIMDALINDPEFMNDLAILYFFTKTQLHGQLPLYQQIVESLKTSLNNSGSIAVIEAFEKVIMKLLHYEHYIFYSEGKWSNVFLTGIRKEWFSPSAWINPSTWLPSYVSADVTQLMGELKQLARVAQRHSVLLSTRLHNKADSYLYWKTRTLKALAGLGLAGAAYRYRNEIGTGLDYAKQTGINAAQNIYDLGTTAATSASAAAASAAQAASDLGSSIYSTGSNAAQAASELGSSLYSSGANAAQAISDTGSSIYGTGANAAEAISNAAGSAYATGSDLANYLGSYIPSYSANQ